MFISVPSSTRSHTTSMHKFNAGHTIMYWRVGQPIHKSTMFTINNVVYPLTRSTNDNFSYWRRDLTSLWYIFECGLGCSTNIHFIHFDLLWIPKFLLLLWTWEKLRTNFRNYQEPWPRKFKDPWKPSKGCTMEIEIQFCIWWALKCNAKRNRTRFRGIATYFWV